uniref:ABC-type xenobiotic transporter n=1 Tax=Leptobrachium leishanense TaxID=445787 RepID=A0A8C5Q1S8_9ANUR
MADKNKPYYNTIDLTDRTPDGKQKNAKNKKEEIKTVGPIHIFRFAEGRDIFYMIIGLLGAIGNGVCLPAIYIIFGNLANSFLCYNSTIQNSSRCADNTPFSEQITRFTIYYIVIGLAVLVGGYAQVSFWVLAAERQTRKLRLKYFHSVLSQEMSWFDVTKAGELNTRLTEDINKINNGIGDKMGHLIQKVSSTVVGLLFGLIKGWQLSLVLIAASPILAIVAAISCKLTVSLANKELSAYAKAGSVAEEVLSSIRTVVAFGGQEKEIKRYTSNLEDAKKYGIKKAIASHISHGVVFFNAYLIYALGFWYGSKLFLEDCGYSISDVLAVLFNLLQCGICLGQAVSYFEAFSVARAAAYSIFKVIDKVSEINRFSNEGYKPNNIHGNVEFKNVNFCYPSRPGVQVLKGFNLKVKSGQIVALVGQSGCGKSTTVQLLQRLYDPLEGEITVDGHDIRSLNVRHYREFIGVVSQEPVLFSTTIRNNIKYGRENVTDAEIEQACKEANAYDFIMELPDKFETLVGERGAQLSGGQKQRIAIARALVRNPKILLLDEATSALDTESESVVQAALDKASEGRTTIVITHRLSTIWTADVIAVIENGVVVEQGTHSKLMKKKGRYYSLATAQAIQLAEEDNEDPPQNKTGWNKMQASSAQLISNSSAKEYELLNVTDDDKEEDKEDETEERNPPKFSYLRLLKLNKSEWPYILLGILAALFNGSAHVLRCTIYTRMLAGFMFGKSGEVLTLRLRKMAFTSMLYQDISWFDNKKNNTGALITRLASDAAQVQTAVGPRLGVIVESSCIMGVSIIIAFLFGWEITLVIVALFPILIFTGILQTRALIGFANLDKIMLRKAGKIATEAVDNIRTVVSLTKEDLFEKMYCDRLQKPYRNVQLKANIYGLFFAFSQSFFYFAQAICFNIGGHMIETGKMTPENLFLVISLVAFGAVIIGEVISFTPDYAKGKTAASDLFELFDMVPTIDSFLNQGHKPDKYQGHIEFRKVYFNYPSRPDVPVLRDLCLKIQSGKTVAFVGSSGCGKSTCVQLLERFYDPLEGVVLFDNIDAKYLNVQWLRSQIGIVSQEPVLFNYSIAENIAYGDNSRTVTMDEIKSAAKVANIHFFIDGLPEKYDTMVGGKGTQLSEGQKQRIAIARALSGNRKFCSLTKLLLH